MVLHPLNPEGPHVAQLFHIFCAGITCTMPLQSHLKPLWIISHMDIHQKSKQSQQNIVLQISGYGMFHIMHAHVSSPHTTTTTTTTTTWVCLKMGYTWATLYPQFIAIFMVIQLMFLLSHLGSLPKSSLIFSGTEANWCSNENSF